MGIDFIVSSNKNPLMYEYNDNNRHLKWAWSDIQWEKIFNILNIHLEVLYDNSIDYWAPCQVKSMRDLIASMANKSIIEDWKDSDWLEENEKKVDKLCEDAIKLLKFFDYYVENEAFIQVL